MQYYIYFIQDFHASLSFKNNEFNILEPFDGLFTQGMVCHETYKDAEGNWLNPDKLLS